MVETRTTKKKHLDLIGKVLETIQSSNNSRLRFIRLLTQNYKKLCTRNKQLQIKLSESNESYRLLNEKYINEIESRNRLEQRKLEIQQILNAIKDVLQNNDVDSAKAKLNDFNLNESYYLHESSGLNVSSNLFKDVDTKNKKIRRSLRNSGRHSAGSLLDPENLSLASGSESDKENRISKRTSSNNRNLPVKKLKEDSPKLRSSSEEYFDLDDVIMDMPPILSKTRIRFDEDADSHSTTSQSTFCDSTSQLSLSSRLNRQHIFESKIAIKGEICGYCGKRVAFRKSYLKCLECKMTVHGHCQSSLVQTCVTNRAVSPSVKSIDSVDPMGSDTSLNRMSKHKVRNMLKMSIHLSDFCPLNEQPQIPALVIHCVNEINARGMQQLGLYRLSGSDKLVKELYMKFIRGKVTPSLALVEDINVVCGCLKLFLRNLDEPLVTYEQRPRFALLAGKTKRTNATHTDFNSAVIELTSIFQRLPTPNRHTLAYLMLHLMRVSNSPHCQMQQENISRIFGPTIVGFSMPEPSVMQMIEENATQLQIVYMLLKLPEAFYAEVLGNDQGLHQVLQQHTPCRPIRKSRAPATVATGPAAKRTQRIEDDFEDEERPYARRIEGMTPSRFFASFRNKKQHLG